MLLPRPESIRWLHLTPSAPASFSLSRSPTFIHLFIFGYACSMQKFLGQGLNPRHSKDKTGSLTARPSGNSLLLFFFFFFKHPEILTLGPQRNPDELGVWGPQESGTVLCAVHVPRKGVCL